MFPMDFSITRFNLVYNFKHFKINPKVKEISSPSPLNILLILYLLRQNIIKHHLIEKEGSHLSNVDTPMNSVSQTKKKNVKC